MFLKYLYFIKLKLFTVFKQIIFVRMNFYEFKITINLEKQDDDSS